MSDNRWPSGLIEFADQINDAQQQRPNGVPFLSRPRTYITGDLPACLVCKAPSESIRVGSDDEVMDFQRTPIPITCQPCGHRVQVHMPELELVLAHERERQQMHPEQPMSASLNQLKAKGVVTHTVVAGGLPEPTAAEVASMTAYTGLVIQPYRTDNGRPAWVFRCWGTDDDCDGYLSLDHSSAQSAARALTRHVEECHTTGAPQPEVTIRIRDGLTEQQRAEVQQLIVEELKRARREARMSR